MRSAELSVAAPLSDRATAAVRALFLAFVVWIPIETIDLFTAQADSRVISISRLIGLALLAFAVVDWRRCFRRIPAAFWPIAWYLAAYSFSQLRVPAELDDIFVKKQALLVYDLAFFVVAVNLLDDAAFRARALRVFGWWTVAVAAAMLAGWWASPIAAAEGRAAILGQDPNATAGFFAAAAICLGGERLLPGSRNSPLRLLPALGAAALAVYALLETGSRGGLLAFVAGALGLAFGGGRAALGRRAVILLALLAVSGGLLAREFSQGTNTSTRLSDSWNEGDTSGRTDIYEVAWEMAKERPLTGFGGANNVARIASELHFKERQRDTHNLALMVVTEVGLLGALPFLGAVFFALWAALRHGRARGDAVPFALVCSQLALNTTVTGTNQNLFWLVLAAAYALPEDPG